MPKRGDRIHKRKDGRWEGRYFKERRSDGSIRYASVYGKSYGEVLRKMAAADPMREKRHVRKKGVTVQDAGTMWLAGKRQNRPSTEAKYAFLLDAHIVPALGKIRIAELTGEAVDAFAREKLESGKLCGEGGLSASYVRSMLMVVEGIHAYAVRNRLCTPFELPPEKPALPGKEKVPLTEEETRQLEAYLLEHPTETNLGILITLYTGLRVGEACALSWGDMDLKQKVLSVRHTVQRVKSEGGVYLRLDVPKTRASGREIPLHDNLLPMLEKMRKDDGIFVVSGRDVFMNPATFQHRFHRALKAAGIRDINFHLLRHTFTTRCIAAGMDLKTLSCILGHASSLVTLDIYTHPTTQQMREEMKKLAMSN